MTAGRIESTSRCQAVGLVVLAAGALVVLGVPVAAAGFGIGKPDYRGRIAEYASSRVEFRLERTGGVLKRVRFQATRVELFCDDSTRPRVELGPIALRSNGPRSFEGSRYSLSATGTEAYLKVRVRLLAGGRARGYLYYFQDGLDPPPAGQQYVPDCATSGDLYNWHARRVS